MLVAFKHRIEFLRDWSNSATRSSRLTAGVDLFRHGLGSMRVVRAARAAGPPPLFAGCSRSRCSVLEWAEPLMFDDQEVTIEESICSSAADASPSSPPTSCLPCTAAPPSMSDRAGHRSGLRHEPSTRPITRRRLIVPPRWSPPTMKTLKPSSREASNAGRCTCTPANSGLSNGPTAGPARIAGARAPARPRRAAPVQVAGPAPAVRQLRQGRAVHDVHKNLAADLRKRLLLLGGPSSQTGSTWSTSTSSPSESSTEAQPGTRLPFMDDDKAIELWCEILLELGESRWDGGFLHDE